MGAGGPAWCPGGGTAAGTGCAADEGGAPVAQHTTSQLYKTKSFLGRTVYTVYKASENDT